MARHIVIWPVEASWVDRKQMFIITIMRYAEEHTISIDARCNMVFSMADPTNPLVA